MYAQYVRNDGTFGSVTGSEPAVREFLRTVNLPSRQFTEVGAFLHNVPPSPLKAMLAGGHVEEPLLTPVMNFAAADNGSPSYAGAAGHHGSGVASHDAEAPLVLPVMF
jgi:hypothetical protein